MNNMSLQVSGSRVESPWPTIQVTTTTGASEFGGATEAIYSMLQSNSSEVGDSVTGDTFSASLFQNIFLQHASREDRATVKARAEQRGGG
jgi:hypothetical protein